MDLPIVLKNPAQVREEMSLLDANARNRGENYFNSGRVRNLRLGPEEGEYLAEVQGTDLYAVRLLFDAEGLAEESCSCPVGEGCKHVYATLKALLVAHTQGSVQVLSARQTPVTAVAKSTSSDDRPFPEQVQAALGRPLDKKEKSFLARLMQLHAQCRQRGTITHWDFQQLGLPLGGYGWDALKIWPAFPPTLREFWLYLAHAASEQGQPLPQFLQPVTDFSEIEGALRRWKREHEVNRWKSALGQTQGVTAPVLAGLTRRVDLRVAFQERAALLEWQPEGQPEFAPLKVTQARELQRQLRQGETELAPESEWIWQAFERRVDFTGRTELEYYDQESQRLLAGLFRLPGALPRLVNARGETLQFASAPLRWHLEPATGADQDYGLRLVQADGAPVPPLICVLGQRAPLYVTANLVFPGPLQQSGVIDPRGENRIPAPALESRGGVTLLRALGLELPPRLRDRVRIVPLTIHFACDLRPAYPGTASEVCAIQAHTTTPDGTTLETWDGHAWKRKGRNPEPESRKDGTIVLHDRNGLENPWLLLSPLGAKWEGYRDHFTVRVTKKFPDLFASWIKSLPPQVHAELKGDLASLTAEAVAGSVKLDVAEAGIDWFDLSVVLDVKDTTLTKEELKLLLNARGGYVRLQGRGWRKLEFNLSEEEDEQLARLGLNPRELTAEPQRLHALQLADTAAKKFLSEPQFERIARRVGEIKARVTPDMPVTVHAELRPYQLEGFHFLAYLAANNFGGILADDMGLGKTLQTLAWLEYLRANVPPASRREEASESAGDSSNNTETRRDAGGTLGTLPSLVVCPKSVMDNWRAESERFVPGLRVKVWGASEVKLLSQNLATADLHVMNYNQLRLLGESLAEVRWLALILDEGQYIKNPSSITAQIARGLQAERRLVLSGTPIENRLLDLWSLMAFAMPGALGSRAQFAKLYDSKEDPHARRRLAARVRPFLLRRTKGQVAKDLPDRSEEDLFCEIEGEQKTLYRAELKRAQQMLLRVTTQKQLAQDRFNILTSLLRLRQICCHPKLVKPDSRASGAKVEALLEQLEPIMEEGHKVLVFSQFVDMLDILRAEIATRDWPTFYLTGATENRGELVKNFQAAEGAAVFLISLKAGGFGLNLTAASYVVLFDPWWNPAVENQAIDRTHRIGQSRNVIAYRLLIKNSIEEKIRALQKKKSALAADVLGEEKFSQSLTLDDLRYLFTDEPDAS